MLGLALAAASPAAAEFQVNTTTYSSQIAGGVARRANGEYVVVWHSFAGLDARWDVFARRFTSAG